ncbi:MAG: hypothetical protein IPN74_09620 [Haliscomenobacter sp.]|nr:hypothetical protein [Haliscomenobacter sp.]MBK8878783.1 hypothetical protein [Haliscomenobacter sp.]
MNQFTLQSRQRTFLIGFMLLGLLCMVITYLTDDALHTRFWTNYLHNTVFFLGIGFISLFILAAFTTSWAGWYVGMKRVWESFSLFLIPGLVLMVPIILGLWGHFHHLYHWADKAEVAKDVILTGKSGFLNPVWYTFGTLILVGAWIFFALKIRQLSVLEDTQGKGVADDFSIHRWIRFWSAVFLPIAGFSSAALIWQWLMSVDSHWYSTMFAWYTGASWFVSAMALTILLLVYLKGQGYFVHITTNHFHDLGKFLFAFSVFWTYLWFSQFMLIWYANIGEETIYFHERMTNYPALFYGNLILNFVLPFLVLMRNDSKRKTGIMVTGAVITFLGHWLDFFLMVKPGARHTAMEALASHGGHGEGAASHALSVAAGFSYPGLLELGTMLGFLAFFLYFVMTRLEKASLLPYNDPYLQETTHHAVWPYAEHE